MAAVLSYDRVAARKIILHRTMEII